MPWLDWVTHEEVRCNDVGVVRERLALQTFLLFELHREIARIDAGEPFGIAAVEVLLVVVQPNFRDSLEVSPHKVAFDGIVAMS